MSTEAVARRYATAAFELAREAGNLEAVTTELAQFAQVYADSEDFRQLDHLPQVTDADRRQVVRALAQKLRASPVTENTVTLLATRGRLAVLPDLVRLLHDLTDEHLGVVRAEVRSAQPLADRYVGRLKATMEEATGKRVVLTVNIDPSLIAGIVTHVKGRVIDGSVRGRLDRLAESLRQN